MDSEKVIKGVESCIKMGRLGVENCRELNCPYFENGLRLSCWLDVLNDAVALLKEQETKWIHREDLDFKDKFGCNHFHGMCENCGFIHDFIDDHTGQYKYCPQCGRSVKWN